MPTVRIDLTPPADPPPGPVTVYARVEDTSQADAPARTVAERVLRDVRLDRPQRLEIDVPAPDPRARYGVRVHVDTSGSGRVGPGDLVTTRSYPVLTQGGRDEVVVEVSPI